MNDKPLVGLTLIFILGICIAKLLHIPFSYLYPVTLGAAILSFIFLRRTAFHLYLIILLVSLALTSLFLTFSPPENLSPAFLKFFSPISKRLENIFDQTMNNPDNLALIKGLVLGKRELLSQEIQEAFKNTGTFHILAISGLHIGLLGFIFFFFFQLLRLPRKVSAILAIPFITIYALMVLSNGFRPSVIRAALMMVCFFIGVILERERNIFNILSFAALVILIFNPLMLFQVGFQLSFLGVLALIMLTPKIAVWIQRILPKLNEKVTIFFSGVIAIQLGAIPIIALYFNIITPVAILANLLVIPLLGLILKVSFCAILSGLFCLPLAKIFNAVNGLLLNALIRVVKLFARFPFAVQEVYTPTPLIIAGYYFFVLGAFFHKELKNLKIGMKKLIFIVLIALNVFIWVKAVQLEPEVLQVNFVDVGQGDAIFIQFPKGGNLLIDGGKIWEGRRKLKPYLWKKGIQKIDVLLLTHPDADHVGGLIPILKGFRVGMVLDPGLVHTSSLYQEFLQLIDKKDIPYELISQGDEIRGFYRTTIQALHPSLPLVTGRGHLNNNSVVLLVEYGKVRFLFTADISEEGEKRIMERNNKLEADILKVPHHGGRSSAYRDFIELINPEIAVICCGENNPYGHPHPETLKLYEELGIKIYRTDLDGPVVIRTDGKDIRIKTER
ncbi:MAG: DNA internalization-related competence protein ComEC/Rec2 [Candidatus Ratteibacteria bacterium]|nr:DNA internalization-related competence protein ComEC/Rec2 [Candidatus Ratteibacteria bacterium]